MSFTKCKIRDFFLSKTEVENIFINEYLPASSGDYVKVYLYGLMYAENGVEMTHKNMAKQLNLSEEILAKAWDHWEAMGVVRKKYNGATERINYDIEYINLRELMYGNVSAEHSQRSDLKGEYSDDAVRQAADSAEIRSETTDKANGGRTKKHDRMRELLDYIEGIMGLTLTAKDIQTIDGWVSDLGVDDDFVKYIFEYCAEKNVCNINYAEKVILNWVKQGILTKESAEENLEKFSERNNRYKRVLKSLGLTNRSATEAEKKKMDVWFDEMNFTMERVLEACDTTISKANPSIQYVNKVLENWYGEAEKRGLDANSKIRVTRGDINRYFKYLREKGVSEAEERRLEIYSAIPRIEEIDCEIKDLGASIAQGALKGEKKEEQDERKKLLCLLQDEKIVLLIESDHPADYMNIKYSCEICKDTGVDLNGSECQCVSNRIGEIELWKSKNF